MKGFFSFVRKETLHILRDRRTMLIVLLMPVVQLLLFGFAISVEVNNIDFAVVASHPTEAVRRQVERIAANPYFTFGGYIRQDEADEVLRTGEVGAVVVFADDYDRRTAGSGEPDGAAQRLHPPKTVDSGKKPDIFPHREVVVEREALAHVADAAFDPLSFAHHVVTGDRTASRRGIAQSAQHPHGGGLSGAVGAEESEDFAPRHIERNAVYGGKIAEPLAQFPDGYDRFTHGASVL